MWEGKVFISRIYICDGGSLLALVGYEYSRFSGNGEAENRLGVCFYC